MSTCTSYVYNKHAWTHALVMYIINMHEHMQTCMNTCTSYVYNKHAWAHALVMYIINMHEHMH